MKRKLFIPAKGTSITLTSDWPFPLYHENRNKSLFKYLGITYQSDASTSSEVTIPAGSILIVDRYYIRGDIRFDSITFRSRIGKATPRFWAKLIDVNLTMPDIKIDTDSEPQFMYTLFTLGAAGKHIGEINAGPFAYSEVTSPNLLTILNQKFTDEHNMDRGFYRPIKQHNFKADEAYIDITDVKDEVLGIIHNKYGNFTDIYGTIVELGTSVAPEEKPEVTYKSQSYYIVVNVYKVKAELASLNFSSRYRNVLGPVLNINTQWSSPPTRIFLKLSNEMTKPEVKDRLSVYKLSCGLKTKVNNSSKYNFTYSRAGLDVLSVVTRGTAISSYGMNDGNTIGVVVETADDIRKYIPSIYAKAVDLGFPIEDIIWNAMDIADYKAANAEVDIPKELILYDE